VGGNCEDRCVRFSWCTGNTGRSRDSSGSIVLDYGLDNWAVGVRSLQRQRISPLSSVSRPALGPT
jgi:hypothetical protein